MTIGNLNIKQSTTLIRLVMAIVFLFVNAGMGCASLKDKNSPSYQGYNVLMISLSNIGVDHMSLYGYKRKTTPYIDKWAQDALVFENAFSHGSWTLPVGTSLFTSLYPYTHKIVARDIQNVLPEGVGTLPEILQENSYRTAAFTGGLDYYKGFSHMRGFEDVDDNLNYAGFNTTLPQAKKWLSQNSDKKFFLFIHGYDTHCPFTPPEKFKEIFSTPKGKRIRVDSRRCVRGFLNSEGNNYQAYYAGGCADFRNSQPCPQEKPVQLTPEDAEYLKDLYDEEVLAADSLVGEFLNSLDKRILEKTIIIILAEHGEMFTKHGRFGRAGTARGTMYDDVIHIPLIIKLPLSSGRKIEGLVQIIDIMPTLLDLLEIRLPLKIQGKSLLPLLEGREDPDEYVYAGLPFQHPPSAMPEYFNINTTNESIRSKNWKLIREVLFRDLDKDIRGENEEETFELYNLQDDPGEQDNVINRFPEKAADLKKRLAIWAVWAKESRKEQPSTKEVPDDLLRDARKSGYW